MFQFKHLLLSVYAHFVFCLWMFVLSFVCGCLFCLSFVDVCFVFCMWMYALSFICAWINLVDLT